MTGAPGGPAAPAGVAILLWSADPDVPARLATPFAMAAAAAAMDTPVEVYFTARSVLLLAPGVAESLHASADRSVSIGDWMRQAREHGATFLACTDALVAHGLTLEALAPGCAGHGGAVRFMARATDPGWRTLVF